MIFHAGWRKPRETCLAVLRIVICSVSYGDFFFFFFFIIIIIIIPTSLTTFLIRQQIRHTGRGIQLSSASATGCDASGN